VSDLLLQTKLFRPALRPSRIDRNHLVERLNQSLNPGPGSFAARLALVSAPAGFGKTTLVSAWLDQLSGVDIAWLSLDENDNGPVRFLTYLVAALQTVVPELGEAAGQALAAPQPPAAEAVLTLVLNEASQHERPVVIILDDYDAIITPAVHQAVAFFLEHLPPALLLVLTTRSDPPLPLSRLRARGQVVEVRSADLRFSHEEVAAFLNQVMGLELTPEALAALEQRTEGWAAGLQLAALSMQGHSDQADFIAAFTGSHRFILDYLTDEVLEQRPKGTRQFLLQTAILDRLCGPLCDAVTGGSDGQAVLERLEQANLFLIPLDQERHWYRYHHLFAEVLLNRLRQETAGPAPGMAAPDLAGPETLHRRASAWFEGQGLMDEAIRHALAAPDLALAADLVEQNIRPLFHRSELLRLRGWLAQLPLELVLSRPRLLLGHCWTLAFTGQNQAARQLLAGPEAQDVLDEATLPAARQGELALLRAMIARALFDGDHGLADAQRALALLPEDQGGLRAGAIHLVGVAQFRRGETVAASRTMAEAVAVGEAEDGPYMALDALQDLASIQIRQGHLEQIKQTCRRAMGLAGRHGGRMLPVAGMAYIDYGGVLYEQNDLDGAEEALDHGLNLLRGSTEHYLVAEGYTLLGGVHLARGNVAGAAAAVAEAETWLRQMQVAAEGTWAFLAQGQARLWLRQGEVGAAARWAETARWWPGETHLGHHQAATLLRLRLAQSRGNGGRELLAAAERLAQLLAAAEARKWWGYVIELSLLQGLARQALGDGNGAVASLERALRLAQAEGFARLFLDEGQAMAELLRRARRPDLAAGYVNGLLAAFPAAAADQRGAAGLPEPLSEREMEVLALMAKGAPNQEIADQLFIALSTVKKHVGNILVKLDTSNRVQAIGRAQELGLLSSFSPE